MLFVDRDGVIIPVEKGKYITDPDEVMVYDYAGPALFRYQAKTGQPIAVVTNQAGIGKGLLPIAKHQEIQNRVEVLLNSHGLDTSPDKFLMVACPHTNEISCGCRKPQAGMLYYAAGFFRKSPIGGFMVGDFWTDMAAGAKCLCQNIQVLTGLGTMAENSEQYHLTPEIAPDEIVRDLDRAIEYILERHAYPVTLDNPGMDLLRLTDPYDTSPSFERSDDGYI